MSKATNKKLEERIEELKRTLALKDAYIRALEEELVAQAPYLRKLADYQAADINRLDHH